MVMFSHLATIGTTRLRLDLNENIETGCCAAVYSHCDAVGESHDMITEVTQSHDSYDKSQGSSSIQLENKETADMRMCTYISIYTSCDLNSVVVFLINWAAAIVD